MSDHPRLLPTVSIPPGDQLITVGGTIYPIPRSAGAVHAQEGLCYVLYLGKIHALVSGGEIAIPPTLRHSLAAAYFGRAGKPEASPIEKIPTATEKIPRPTK